MNDSSVKHKVRDERAGMRLDKLVHELFEIPWSRTRKLIELGKISVDGRITRDLSFPVESGQTVVHDPLARRVHALEGFDPQCIRYLDTHILVASKPSGVLTLPFERGDKGSFLGQLKAHLARTRPQTKKRRGPLPSLMTVHRLDKGTSGLIVFARTRTAKEGLATQFKEHSVSREYLALVHGAAKSKKIETRIMDDRGDGIRGSRESSPNGDAKASPRSRIAITIVQLEKTYNGASLVSCRLKTGRTNQIRIHMSEEGHPLLGETTYLRGFKGQRIDAPHLMLHATSLEFVHPVSGEKLAFREPWPETFKQVISKL